jgi:DNA polymerase V
MPLAKRLLKPSNPYSCMQPISIVDVSAVAKASSAHESSPLYASSPAAGFPAPGDDMVEKSLDVHDLLVKHPASTFFVRVQGDSMEGAGIFSGDILVVDRSVEPVVGKIVVAAINGELVVKRIGREGNLLILLSENESYAPIVVGESEDCFVWGVVTGSARTFE